MLSRFANYPPNNIMGMIIMGDTADAVSVLLKMLERK